MSALPQPERVWHLHDAIRCFNARKTAISMLRRDLLTVALAPPAFLATC